MAVKYKRILLKLSGEALAGKKGQGLDSDTLRAIGKTIFRLTQKGVETAIVVGGGNFWRGEPAKVWIVSPLIISVCWEPR